MLSHSRIFPIIFPLSKIFPISFKFLGFFLTFCDILEFSTVSFKLPKFSFLAFVSIHSINFLFLVQDFSEFAETTLAYHVLHAFLTIPGYLVKELANVLKEKLKKLPKFVEFILKCGGVLSSSVQHSLMPWDMRWFRRGFHPNGNINCLFAYIKHVFDKTVMECSSVETDFMSLRQYSDAVDKGTRFFLKIRNPSLFSLQAN